jgi:hypothetical protein
MGWIGLIWLRLGTSGELNSSARQLNSINEFELVSSKSVYKSVATKFQEW